MAHGSSRIFGGERSEPDVLSSWLELLPPPTPLSPARGTAAAAAAAAAAAEAEVMEAVLRRFGPCFRECLPFLEASSPNSLRFWLSSFGCSSSSAAMLDLELPPLPPLLPHDPSDDSSPLLSSSSAEKCPDASSALLMMLFCMLLLLLLLPPATLLLLLPWLAPAGCWL
jgi:fermentation-respiration switch protein FrsA (DUF1100 family)